MAADPNTPPSGQSDNRYVPMSAVRAQGGKEREAMRAFPPFTGDHPSLDGGECAVCGVRFVAGDVPALIPLGPGDDLEAQAKAMRGGWYSCHAVIAHAACAGVTTDA